MENTETAAGAEEESAAAAPRLPARLRRLPVREELPAPPAPPALLALPVLQARLALRVLQVLPESLV